LFSSFAFVNVGARWCCSCAARNISVASLDAACCDALCGAELAFGGRVIAELLLTAIVIVSYVARSVRQRSVGVKTLLLGRKLADEIIELASERLLFIAGEIGFALHLAGFLH
jgi:hypothetical protein